MEKTYTAYIVYNIIQDDSSTTILLFFSSIMHLYKIWFLEFKINIGRYLKIIMFSNIRSFN